MSEELVTGQVIGAEAVALRLGLLAPTGARERVSNTVKTLGFMLERKVVLEKLNGQVLKRQTGRLARSINTRFSQDGDTYTSSTGTALVYGRAWELGFHIPARVIEPKSKKALFWPGAAHPVRRVNQPARDVAARPFLRPALLELAPTIRSMLTKSLEGI